MPKKKRPKFIFTVSRARMVETMTAHRKSPEEIADALGCSTEMVVDFLATKGEADVPPEVHARIRQRFLELLAADEPDHPWVKSRNNPWGEEREGGQ